MEDGWTKTPQRRPGSTEPPVRIAPARGTAVPILKFTTGNQFEPIAEPTTDQNTTKTIAEAEVITTTEDGVAESPVLFRINAVITNTIATAAAYISPNRLFPSRILSAAAI